MRHPIQLISLLWALALSLAGTSLAAEKIPPSATTRLTLTIYNQGTALINEVRDVTVKTARKPFELVFEGVPTTIDAPSLQVKSSSEGFRILEQNYEYDLINTQNLLNKYLGKELLVAVPDLRERDKTVFKKAVLIANNDRPIFRMDDQIYLGSYSALLLAEIPEELRARPALVWLVKNTTDRKQTLEVSYLAGGFSWKADYVLKVSPDDTLGTLSGWVTLENQSGMSFSQAHLKLVAGDIHRAAPTRVMPRTTLRFAKRGMEEKIKQESFFEYHLYTVPRKVTLKNNQTKQIMLLQTQPFAVKKLLKVTNSRPFYFENPWRGPSTKEHPTVYIEFQNSKENSLGVPLPKGIVRAYKKASDGSVLLIGEDRIPHTPEGEKISLTMGKAFDITVERKQTDYRKWGERLYETSWEIQIRNAKDIPQVVVLEEHIPGGEWRLTLNPDGFEKIASHWIRATVKVPAKEKKTLAYSVQIKY